MAGSRKWKSPRKGSKEEGSKDPTVLCLERAKPAIDGPEVYRSLVDQEDLILVRTRFCVPKDYEIELPEPDARIDDPPPGRLGVYEDSFEVELRFPLHPSVLELLRAFGIPLSVLIPNSIRHIIGFLGLCFLAEI